MNTKQRLFLCISVLLVSACAQKEIPKPQPKPVAVKKPKPLIQIDQVTAESKGKSQNANIHFSNITNDTYQYILFKTTAYDKEGKVIKARKSLDQSAYLRTAGPVAPRSSKVKTEWKNTWRSKNVHCVNVEQVEIIFSNGAVEVVSGERLIQPKNHACLAWL